MTTINITVRKLCSPRTDDAVQMIEDMRRVEPLNVDVLTETYDKIIKAILDDIVKSFHLAYKDCAGRFHSGGVVRSRADAGRIHSGEFVLPRRRA